MSEGTISTNGAKLFYSLKEVATKIGCHPRTLQKMLKKNRKNRPPFIKIGARYYRFPVKQFHEWAEGAH